MQWMNVLAELSKGPNAKDRVEKFLSCQHFTTINLMSIVSGFGDKIACLCLNHFYFLKSKKGKPEENKQWTVLACFVKEQDSELKVVALGTGTSCLGFSQVSQSGKLIHDCHAEIIARRSFNRYLFDQLNKSSKDDSIFVLNHHSKKFQLKDRICFHFYSSQSPCGDASIYQIKSDLTKTAKRKASETILLESKRPKLSEEDISAKSEPSSRQLDIHRTGAKCAPGEKPDRHGCGVDYHEVGSLRTKPGRGISTHSMSCSDKMMKWNIMGCQGALMSFFLEKPIYIASFTMPEETWSLSVVERALFKRVSIPVVSTLLKHTAFNLNEPQIFGTKLHFRFFNFRHCNLIPCGSSISWCDIAANDCDVIAKNGLKLGIIKKHQHLPKAASAICRLELFKTFKDLLNKFSCTKTIQVDVFAHCFKYNEFKNCLDYNDVWNNLRDKVFPHWLQHDRNLDTFSSESIS